MIPFDGGSFSCSLQPAWDTTTQRLPHLSLQTTTVFPRYLTNRTRRPWFDHTEHKRQICASVFHFIGSQKGVGFAKSFCSQTTDVSDVKAAVFFLPFLPVIVSQTQLHVKGWWAGETSHSHAPTGWDAERFLIFLWRNFLFYSAERNSLNFGIAFKWVPENKKDKLSSLFLHHSASFLLAEPLTL